MRAWLLSDLEAPLHGQRSGNDISITGVSTDTRDIHAGDLFVALRGENFDGHDYLEQAQSAGAVAAVLSRQCQTDLPSLKVVDTQKALGLLGAHNRQAFEGTLIGITGSGGKTTVKNMLLGVLSQKGATLATKGNFNNEIGVPLTLLNLTPEHRFAVVEMGAARAGDIAWLAQLGRPSIAVLLNAMPAHLEGFGSVEEVAHAKGEIFDSLQAGDVAVMYADQPWVTQWRARAGEATVIEFGLSESASIRAESIREQSLEGVTFTAMTPIGDFPVTLSLPGEHNVINALAAIAVGVACELSIEDIQRGLASVSPVSGRLTKIAASGGATLIDDCYNANPGSVKAAIDVLAQCAGRRTLVLGEMKELGPSSDALHREVAEYAKVKGIEGLWGVGSRLLGAVEGFGHGGMFFADTQAAIDSIEIGQFTPVDTVLVKGSRSAAMEVVLQALANVKHVGEG